MSRCKARFLLVIFCTTSLIVIDPISTYTQMNVSSTKKGLVRLIGPRPFGTPRTSKSEKR
jgi:hypothetical protein